MPPILRCAAARERVSPRTSVLALRDTPDRRVPIQFVTASPAQAAPFALDTVRAIYQTTAHAHRDTVALSVNSRLASVRTARIQPCAVVTEHVSALIAAPVHQVSLVPAVSKWHVSVLQVRAPVPVMDTDRALVRTLANVIRDTPV